MIGRDNFFLNGLNDEDDKEIIQEFIERYYTSIEFGGISWKENEENEEIKEIKENIENKENIESKENKEDKGKEIKQLEAEWIIAFWL